MQKFTYQRIGTIYSPFNQAKGTPIQASVAKAVKGKIILQPEYTDGLKDLEGFSHIFLLYHFHLSKKKPLILKPFLDDIAHGVFAIRGPSRPNPIGISIVRLLKIKNNILYIEDLDIIDGTPLLDIKPYIPQFDERKGVKTAWLDSNISKLDKSRDDGRFVE